MTRPGFSCSTTAFRILATASGSSALSVFTRMPRSAPMASPVRMVSAACGRPIDTQTISLAWPFSLSRSASSTAISSKGFIDILTFASSTPLPSLLTRILTLKSPTRFTGTRIFMEFALATTVAAVAPARRRQPNGRCLAVSTEVGQPGRPPGALGTDLHHRVWYRLHALKQPDRPRLDQRKQDGSGQHPAEMAPIGHLALRGCAQIPQLADHEQPDDPIGADPQWNDADQYRDLGAGPQHDVADHNSGDRARRADQLDAGMGIIGHEDQPADDTTEEIEYEVAGAAEHPFDVVAEHPQEDHVAEDVRNIGVQELISDECHESGHPRPRADVTHQGRGRETQTIDHAIERELTCSHFVEIDQKIDRDQRPRDHRLHRWAERVVIVDRHHHAMFPRSPVLSRLPQHVGCTLVVGVPPRDEQKIRESVDVFERRRRDALARL